MDPHLARVFEAAYQDFHQQFQRERDPISLVHPYAEADDREVAAFLTALLSYGNVPTILRGASHVLKALGTHPAKHLRSEAELPRLDGFRHRFTTGSDMEVVLHWCRGALREAGSLEAFFDAGPGGPLRTRLGSFVHRLWEQPLPPRLAEARKRRMRPLRHLLSHPDRGSACKRLNLFLRWVVRPADGVDLGLWSVLAPRDLVLPLDTHLLKTLRQLGWAKGTGAGWAVAEQATRRLAQYCPEDPLRYDFALCHLSMEGRGILHYKAGHHAALEPGPIYEEGQARSAAGSVRLQTRRD